VIWHLSHRADPRGVPIADRHYNRQKIGAPQFVPPGRCLVLLTEKADALWITSWPFAEFVKHEWAGAWVCSCFRNESEHLSSSMIVEAVAATRFAFGEPPPLGFVTFVDTDKTRRKRDPGRCYLRAGWNYEYEKDEDGNRKRKTTKGGLVVLRLMPEEMSAPAPAIGSSLPLFGT